jgi:hypothetical protein
MIALEYELTYRLRPVGPMPATEGSPYGARQYWEMADAELDGPRVNAKARYPGIDWFRPGSDGFGRPDVRVQFETDDGAVILLHYTGLVVATDAFNRAAETNGSTEFGDQIMRMAMTFETGAAGYSWLNQSLFVAEGRLRDGSIEYRVYRVT